MKDTVQNAHKFSSQKIYKFSFGNSTSGPIGAVFDVVADDEHKALDRARDVLEYVWMGIDVSGAFENDLHDVEYCRVYTYADAIGLQHIEMMYDPSTDSWYDYPLLDRKKPQVPPKKRTRAISRKK